MHAHMIKNDMGDGSYTYDLELNATGQDEKTIINLVCLTEDEAWTLILHICAAIENAQGFPVTVHE